MTSYVLLLDNLNNPRSSKKTMSSIVRKSNRVKNLIYRTLNQAEINKSKKRRIINFQIPNEKKRYTLQNGYCLSKKSSYKNLPFNSDNYSQSSEEGKRKYNYSKKGYTEGPLKHRNNHHKHHSHHSKHKHKKLSREKTLPSSTISSDSDSSQLSLLSNTSSSDSLNAKRFRKKERRKILRARRRCLPLNFTMDDLNKNSVLKDRLRIGRSLTDVEPMAIDNNITFSDIGGLVHHIKSLKEMVVLPLLYPEIYDSLNITPPRGVLFYGPPGTGKTLLARALVNECSLGIADPLDNLSEQGNTQNKISFFMRKGSDCLSKWVGESERQLRILFDQAYKMRPSIIFFDEIDGLAPVRSSRQEQIHNSIVSTFLALLDGLDSRCNIVVIGATNRLDAIDPAFRRPGRFDREFLFPMPNRKVREQILQIHTDKWDPPIDKELLLHLSLQTNGFTGADIKGLCTEAALAALRQTFPDIYDTRNKLAIQTRAIKIKKRHFALAFSTLIPCTMRHCIKQPLARNLPDHLLPLLKPAYDLLRNKLDSFIPPPLPSLTSPHHHSPARKTNVDPRSELLSSSSPVNKYNIDQDETIYNVAHDEEEEDDDNVSVISEHALTRITSIKSDLTNSQQSILLRPDRSWQINKPSLTRRRNQQVYKPRILITGKNRHFGQTTHLAPAILNSTRLDGYFTSLIDLPTLYGNSMKLPEESCFEIFREAQRLTPSLIYLPRIDHWWNCISETLKTTIISLIQGIPSSVTLLILATADKPFDQLPQEIQDMFFNKISSEQKIDISNASKMEKSLVNVLEIKKPGIKERELFFNWLFQDAFMTIRKVFLKRNIKVLRKTSKGSSSLSNSPQRLGTVKPSLKSAGLYAASHAFPAGIRSLDKAEIHDLREHEEETLRELRIFLRDILGQLARDKKFQTFLKPVNQRDVPDYYLIVKTPMDLSEMRNRIDGHVYLTPSQFLNDIELICRNALEYNPNYTPEDKVLRHRACALLDEAKSLLYKQLEPTFGKLCEQIAAARRSRGDAQNCRSTPQFISVPPKNIKDEIFSQYYSNINYDPTNYRISAAGSSRRGPASPRTSFEEVRGPPQARTVNDRRAGVAKTRNQCKTINLNININALGQHVGSQDYRFRTASYDRNANHGNVNVNQHTGNRSNQALRINTTTAISKLKRTASLSPQVRRISQASQQNSSKCQHVLVKCNKSKCRKTLCCNKVMTTKKRAVAVSPVPAGTICHGSCGKYFSCGYGENYENQKTSPKDFNLSQISPLALNNALKKQQFLGKSTNDTIKFDGSDEITRLIINFKDQDHIIARDERNVEKAGKVSTLCHKLISQLCEGTDNFNIDQLDHSAHVFSHKILTQFLQEYPFNSITLARDKMDIIVIQLQLLDMEFKFLQFMQGKMNEISSL